LGKWPTICIGYPGRGIAPIAGITIVVGNTALLQARVRVVKPKRERAHLILFGEPGQDVAVVWHGRFRCIPVGIDKPKRINKTHGIISNVAVRIDTSIEANWIRLNVSAYRRVIISRVVLM
jgi:hypothetical protein